MFFIDEKSGFLSYKTNKNDLALMYRFYDLMFSENNNRINRKTVENRKESRLAGILGEIVFGYYLGASGTPSGQGNVPYDYTYCYDGKVYKIDVKCKYRAVKPRKDFEASIYTYQYSDYFKDVDFYAFLSTTGNFEQIWLCAYANKNQWINNPKGKLWKKGDIDKTNGKVYKSDTWNVFYKDLPQFQLKPFLSY